jgi:hypothetical protein
MEDQWLLTRSMMFTRLIEETKSDGQEEWA